MNVCSYCNTGFPLEENSCPKCGSTEFTKLVRSTMIEQIHLERIKKKRMIIVVSICIVAIIILWFCFIIGVHIQTNS